MPLLPVLPIIGFFGDPCAADVAEDVGGLLMDGGAAIPVGGMALDGALALRAAFGGPPSASGGGIANPGRGIPGGNIPL